MPPVTHRFHPHVTWLALMVAMLWTAGCKSSTTSRESGESSGSPLARDAGETILETAVGESASPPRDSAQAMGDVFKKLAANTRALVANQTELSLRLLRETPPDPQGNRLLSPWVLSSALHQVMLGALGDTEAEMRSALFARLPGPEQHAALHLVNLRLQRAGGSPTTRLRLAHRGWVSNRFALSEPFIKQLRKIYNADWESLDSVGNRAKAVADINAWVSQRTQGKIPSVITALPEEPTLLLVAATHFEGTWISPFPKKDTRAEPFRGFAGETPTPLMRQKGTFPYVEAEGIQVVSLPYQGQHFSFLLLLPAPGKKAFDDFVSRLSTAQFNRLKASLQPREVQVVMPRFRLRVRQEARSTLEALGMKRAFTPQADFSSMTTKKEPLWIQEVIHEAFVEVHEEGTEAAAAAGVGARGRKATATPEIRVDRPFLFVILHQKTGVILFVGQVATPPTSS